MSLVLMAHKNNMSLPNKTSKYRHRCTLRCWHCRQDTEITQLGVSSGCSGCVCVCVWSARSSAGGSVRQQQEGPVTSPLHTQRQPITAGALQCCQSTCLSAIWYVDPHTLQTVRVDVTALDTAESCVKVTEMYCWVRTGLTVRATRRHRDFSQTRQGQIQHEQSEWWSDRSGRNLDPNMSTFYITDSFTCEPVLISVHLLLSHSVWRAAARGEQSVPVSYIQHSHMWQNTMFSTPSTIIHL